MAACTPAIYCHQRNPEARPTRPCHEPKGIRLHRRSGSQREGLQVTLRGVQGGKRPLKGNEMWFVRHAASLRYISDYLVKKPGGNTV